MAIRAFKTTFLISIDEDEARDEEQRTNPEPVTIEELKEYLRKALVLDVNTDEYDNEIGFSCVEVGIEQLTELDAAEVKRLYSKD